MSSGILGPFVVAAIATVLYFLCITSFGTHQLPNEHIIKIVCGQNNVMLLDDSSYRWIIEMLASSVGHSNRRTI